MANITEAKLKELLHDKTAKHLTNLNFSGLDLAGLDFSGMTIASTDFSGGLPNLEETLQDGTNLRQRLI